MRPFGTLAVGLLCLLLPACPSFAQTEAPASRTGSAFVVHRDGYLLTCAHCVEKGWKIEVKLGGKTYVAAVLASDDRTDLALLKIDARALAALPLADSDTVGLAEDVRAFGYPLGRTTLGVTRGSISAIDTRGGRKVLEVDAAINPGGSGGPVVNERGEAIGIANAKLVGAEVENVGLAVPSSDARALLRRHGVAFATKGAKGRLAGTVLAKRVAPTVGRLEARPPPVRRFTAHPANRSCVPLAFSPDGETLATGGNDATVKLWDSRTGQLKRTLLGHDDWVTAVAYAPDGRTLASGSEDASVRLWDAQSGKLTRTLRGHSGPVTGIAFGPGGKVLASSSYDRTVRLWDIQAGRVVRTLVGHTHWVMGVALTPEGATVASAGYDRSVRLWDARTGKLKRYVPHEFIAKAVAVSPDGATVASGSGRGVRLWDLRTGRLKQTLRIDPGRLSSLVFSPDGQMVVTTCQGGGTMFWHVATGRELDPYGGLPKPRPRVLAARSIAFGAGGRLLAFATGDSKVAIASWDPKFAGQTGRKSPRPAQTESPVFAKPPAPAEPRDRTALTVREVSFGRVGMSGFQDTVGPENRITVSPDGLHAAYVAVAPDALYHMVVDGLPLRGHHLIFSQGYHGTKAAAVFSADGRHLAYQARRRSPSGRGDTERHFVVLDGVAGEEFERGQIIWDLRLSRDGRRVAFHTFGEGGAVVDGVRQAPQGHIERGSLRFSPDGARLAYVADRGGKRVVVDGVPGKAYAQIVPGSLTFSPDGKRVAYAAWIGKFPPRLTFVVDNVEGPRYWAMGGVAYAVSFSPDSRRVAYNVQILDADRASSTSHVVVDGVLGKPYRRILPLATGRQGEPPRPWGEKRFIRFSPDSKRYAYVTDRGLVVDGKEVYAVGRNPPSPARVLFSPDSRRWAYVKDVGHGFEAVVVDGKEGKRHEAISDLAFSPDGGRVVYVARASHPRGNLLVPQVAVVDGREGKPYDRISHLTVSPDGRHTAFWAARPGVRWVMVVGGEESRPYDAVVPESKLVFHGPRSVCGFAIRAREVFRVEAGFGEAPAPVPALAWLSATKFTTVASKPPPARTPPRRKAPELPKRPGQWAPLFDGRSLAGWEAPTEFAGWTAPEGDGRAGEVLAKLREHTTVETVTLDETTGRILRGRKSVVRPARILLKRGRPVTGIVWTGRLPTEGYELALEVQRDEKEGGDCPAILFPVGDEWCRLAVGGWENTIVGLDRVDGQPGNANVTTRRMTTPVGAWYEVRLRVTDAKVETWIDGKKVIDLPRAGHRFSVGDGWRRASLGIYANATSASLREIRMQQVSDWSRKPAPDAPPRQPAEPKVLAAKLPGRPEEWVSLFDGKTLQGWKTVEYWLRGVGLGGHAFARSNRIVLEGRWKRAGVTCTGPFPTTDYEVALDVMFTRERTYCHVVFPCGGSTHSLAINSPIPSARSAVVSRAKPRQKRVDLDVGRWHSVRLRVTSARTQAWVDGSPVDHPPIRRHSGSRDWTGPAKPFGIIATGGTVAVANVNLRPPASGSGRTGTTK